MGTVPICRMKGRNKPFRLRMTIGGKRHAFYFATMEEAKAEWQRLAPSAGRARKPVAFFNPRPLVNDLEAAEYLNLRARLATIGMTLSEAVSIAISAHNSVSKSLNIEAKTGATTSSNPQPTP